MSDARAPHEAERDALHAALQRVIDEYRPGALLVGWLLAAEVAEGEAGGRTLMHRSGEAGGGSLAPWTAYGMAGAILEDARDTLRRQRRDVDDERG